MLNKYSLGNALVSVISIAVVILCVYIANAEPYSFPVNSVDVFVLVAIFANALLSLIDARAKARSGYGAVQIICALYYVLAFRDADCDGAIIPRLIFLMDVPVVNGLYGWEGKEALFVIFLLFLIAIVVIDAVSVISFLYKKTRQYSKA